MKYLIVPVLIFGIATALNHCFEIQSDIVFGVVIGLLTVAITSCKFWGKP